MQLEKGEKSRWILALAFLYLCIPVVIFLLGWVKLILSIPISLAILYSAIRAIQQEEFFQTNLFENKKKLLVIFAILTVFVVLSGVGGFAWQNRWDHMYRNAVFRDLVQYNWPIVNFDFEEPRTLCYYLGFWLPSALVGKAFGLQAGYWFQFVWALIGVFLAFLLISEFLKKLSYKTVLFFIFFSGLDILPFLLYQIKFGEAATILPRLLLGEHLELTLYKFNSSCNTTLLFWLYNQAVPFWVGFMMVLREKTNRNRLFTWTLLLLYAPFPALALVPLLVYQFFQGRRFRGEQSAARFRQFLRETITFENFTGLLIGLVIALYFASNASAGKLHIIALNRDTVIQFSLFISTEFIVFLLFVFRSSKRDPILWILFFTMICFSFIQMGDSFDFAWRTCIPAAFYLMLLVIKWTDTFSLKAQWKKILFIVAILLGCITPFMEILRTTEHTVAYYCVEEAASESLINDPLNSVFDNPKDPSYGNFIGDYNSLFVKYLQRK
ncbi:MAG: hypothetical protein GX417_12470 [Clostridiales bacterium]|nr:hypothetical protein [Clostridiales bacterium]